jgi:hypothetical protein
VLDVLFGGRRLLLYGSLKAIETVAGPCYPVGTPTKRSARKGPGTKGPARKGPGYERSGDERSGKRKVRETKGPATKGPATKGPATKGPEYERSGYKTSGRVILTGRPHRRLPHLPPPPPGYQEIGPNRLGVNTNCP